MKKEVLFILFCLIVYFTEVSAKVYKDSKDIMGTKWDITIVGVSLSKAKKVSNEVFNDIKHIDKIMSLYKYNSELSKINELANGEKWFEEINISSEIAELLKEALKVSDLSNGAFDVTIAPLVKLWGFAGGKYKVPTEDEIRKAKELVNYRNIILNSDKSTIKFLKKGMMLDFGGIAKGYAIDRAMQILKSENIENAMINAGGQVRVIGMNPEGKLWRVGVRHPRDKEKFITILECTDRSISTSGDYEHLFNKNNTFYHHIIDPVKGISSYNSISTTVILNLDDKYIESTFADALSTAVFVLGSEKGMELIKRVRGAEGIIVSEDLREKTKGIKIKVSKGLENLEFLP